MPFSAEFRPPMPRTLNANENQATEIIFLRRFIVSEYKTVLHPCPRSSLVDFGKEAIAINKLMRDWWVGVG